MNIQTDFRAIINWFLNDYMILNSEKCDYMCNRKNCANDTFIHSGEKFKNSKEETILSVIINNNKLTFDSHINKTCKKIDQKLSEISPISAFIDLNKRQIVFQSIFKAWISDCPLVQMFFSRKSNKLMNKIHEIFLRIVTSDKNSIYEDLIKSNNQITVHQRDFQILMTKFFKIINDLNPLLMIIFYISWKYS